MLAITIILYGPQAYFCAVHGFMSLNIYHLPIGGVTDGIVIVSRHERWCGFCGFLSLKSLLQIRYMFMDV